MKELISLIKIESMSSLEIAELTGKSSNFLTMPKESGLYAVCFGNYVKFGRAKNLRERALAYSLPITISTGFDGIYWFKTKDIIRNEGILLKIAKESLNHIGDRELFKASTNESLSVFCCAINEIFKINKLNHNSSIDMIDLTILSKLLGISKEIIKTDIKRNLNDCDIKILPMVKLSAIARLQDINNRYVFNKVSDFLIMSSKIIDDMKKHKSLKPNSYDISLIFQKLKHIDKELINNDYLMLFEFFEDNSKVADLLYEKYQPKRIESEIRPRLEVVQGNYNIEGDKKSGHFC